ncbi:protein kinase [bacterium]|nr:protein kinase [bacterium]
MDDKTFIATSPEYPTFLYKEDYLLFGMMVRHGLCDPGDYPGLVEAQRRRNDKPALVKLLTDGGGLTPKAVSDIQTLLNVLAEPKLRSLLPSEMPEVGTIVAALDKTQVDKTLVDKTEVQDVTAQRRTPVTEFLPRRDSLRSDPTVVDSMDSGIADTRLLASGESSITATHLSDAELARLSSAKVKSKLIGEVLQGHILLDRLGSGGQGDVYLAKQISLNRYVALKKLEVPRGLDAQAYIAAFRREAQTLAAINHNRIVKVYEIFQQGDAAFFTMEYLNGKTLKDLVSESGGALPLELVANLACQSISALGRTAQDGLVHRDIKPANIMVDENGDLKIVDFGLAAAAASFGDQSGSFAGTPQFASPEQAQLLPLTPATDQYSLGLTLYYIATGKSPFSARKVQDVLDMQVNVTPDEPSTINTDLPRSVDRVIMRMIAKKPEDRYASFDECFNEWERILTESGRGKMRANKQLLGESLLRFSKEEKNKVAVQSALLIAAWTLLAAGTMLGEQQLRRAGLVSVLNYSGTIGTYVLAFSLCCIFYVAAARRHYLPIIGSLRAWLYTHIATAILAVALMMIHSGNFLQGILPGPPAAKPWLSLLMATTLLVTAISGSVGLMIFRGLRRTLQIQAMELRGSQVSPREQMMTVLSAELLSGWRLVHYPLAIFFASLVILHIIQTIRYSFG